jgi:acyl dehydratase
VARYLNDFTIGDAFETGEYAVSLEEALAFARSFDPQPFHLYAGEAARSVFRDLVVSGWHTAAITMRLVVDSGVLRESGVIGTGIDELRWLAPVKPGDTLHVKGEVIGLEPWPSNQRRGTMRVALQTINQDGAVVFSEIAALMLPVRPEPG